MPTFTTNYNFNKPLVNNATDADLWGAQLNSNWDEVDSILAGANLDNLGTEQTLPSATTTDLGSIGDKTNIISITGTTTITSFGSQAVTSLPLYFVRFTGVLTLTHNATSLILPSGANITTAAGDAAIMKYEGTGNWRCINYARASGAATASDFFSVPIPRVVDGDLKVAINLPFAFTINSVTSKCTSGTVTATTKINTTALGGTANSISSSEQEQVHASANAVAVGDDLNITFASNSACLGAVLTYKITRV